MPFYHTYEHHCRKEAIVSLPSKSFYTRTQGSALPINSVVAEWVSEIFGRQEAYTALASFRRSVVGRLSASNSPHKAGACRCLLFSKVETEGDGGEYSVLSPEVLSGEPYQQVTSRETE